MSKQLLSFRQILISSLRANEDNLNMLKWTFLNKKERYIPFDKLFPPSVSHKQTDCSFGAVVIQTRMYLVLILAGLDLFIMIFFEFRAKLGWERICL